MRCCPVPVIGLAALAFAAGPAHAQGYPTDPGDLTITEFMAEPGVIANYYGEWFEIYNASGRNLNLNGLRVEGSSPDDVGFTVSGSVLLSAGQYAVFAVSDDTSKIGDFTVDYVYNRDDFPLNETGDTIKLVYGSVVLDSVTWDSADWTVVNSYTTQVNKNALGLEWANDLYYNWCLAKSAIFYSDGSATGMYGTPGAKNDECDGSSDDTDGDGWTEAQGDCDDHDPYVNPHAIDGDADPYGNANDDANCNGVRDDGVTDDDGDGYTEVDGDCNDDNAEISPDATEIVDGIDNDCNGCIDDLDTDGDGWTECDSGEIIDCSATDDWDCATDGFMPGRCAFAYDCGEGDNFTYPCAPETVDLGTAYNGKDESCDGYDRCDLDDDRYDADETWVSEYGIRGSCAVSTSPEVGGVEVPGYWYAQGQGGDCDDNNALVNPGRSEGDPSAGGEPDGLDNDCNGVVDDPWLDQDGDGYSVEDGDCWDSADDPEAALVYPGAPETCDDLLDNDCNGLANDGCSNPARYAVIEGGSLCSTVPGFTSGAAALSILLISLGTAGWRRRPRKAKK